MWLMKKGNIIYKVGLLFVFVGVMLPGTAGAAIPSACDGEISDITNQEDTFVDGIYSVDPTNCYKFTVGNDPGQLTVILTYEGHVDNVINLDMNLFDSSGSDSVRQTTKDGDFQGTEPLFETAIAGETYYIQINGTPSMDGHAYRFSWVDQDNTADPAFTEGSEIPKDDGTPFAPGVAGQTLRVTAENTTTCHIYYKDEDDADFTDSGELTVSDDGTGGLYCQVTVQYGESMNNNGANYWYVQAGATRYPSTGTLSFTVQSLQPLPEISTPSPTDGAPVTAGVSGQLLQVVVTNADSCIIYYGVDETDMLTSVAAGTLTDDYCEVTISLRWS
ncbi:hypothetical protein GMJAKD_11150 [Candidatus Electrothrix aarhusensis]